MLLKAGHWLGRGSLLPEGASLGEKIECDLVAEEDRGGMTLSGTLSTAQAASLQLSIRIAADEVGTYVIDARIGQVRVDGVAKLESAPNLGLLWNDAGGLHAAFTLFPVANGYGLRGFLRERGRTLTWELALSLKQDALKASNVVSLRRRRWPRKA